MQEKYANKIKEGQNDFKNYLDTINRQIDDIQNLVDEFSHFARMPSPIFKKMNIVSVVKRAVDFSKMSSKIISTLEMKIILLILMVMRINYISLINLIKNSEESIDEKKEKNRF